MSGGVNVSGTVRSSGLICTTTGTMARQFDCGTGVVAIGAVSITFNITFVNTPSVVVTTTGVSSKNIWCCTTSSITTTGCAVHMTYFNTGATPPGPEWAGDNFSWIAMG